jgi:hypothetical protein
MIFLISTSGVAGITSISYHVQPTYFFRTIRTSVCSFCKEIASLMNMHKEKAVLVLKELPANKESWKCKPTPATG